MSSHHPDWTAAACRDVDPELFFPIGDGPLTHRQTSKAKSVCRRCPLAGDCAAWAVGTGIPEGIWGGLTPIERSRAADRSDRLPERGGRVRAFR